MVADGGFWGGVDLATAISWALDGAGGYAAGLTFAAMVAEKPGGDERRLTGAQGETLYNARFSEFCWGKSCQFMPIDAKPAVLRGTYCKKCPMHH